MDKCRQDICYLNKCHHDSWHVLKTIPEIQLACKIEQAILQFKVLMLHLQVSLNVCVW